MFIFFLRLFYINEMAPRGNKYVKRAIITDKKRRSWNALEKLVVVLYQEKVCSVRSAATKVYYPINPIKSLQQMQT